MEQRAGLTDTPANESVTLSLTTRTDSLTCVMLPTVTACIAESDDIETGIVLTKKLTLRPGTNGFQRGSCPGQYGCA